MTDSQAEDIAKLLHHLDMQQSAGRKADDRIELLLGQAINLLGQVLAKLGYTPVVEVRHEGPVT